MNTKIKSLFLMPFLLLCCGAFALAACSSTNPVDYDTTADEGAPEAIPDVDGEGEPELPGDAPDLIDVPPDEEVVSPCEDGQTLCGDKCVDTLTDPEHCGGCNITCPYPQHAGPSCEGGECEWSCLAGWVNSDGLYDNGCECELQEANESICGDLIDNDCDGRVDCADSDCEGAACGENGLVCDGGFCVCSYGEATEVTCGDGVDNDCDGTADCGDADCSDLSCGDATDKCCSTSCVDTRSSFYHCGICYNDCDSGEVCNLGVCGVACSGERENCGGSCVDTSEHVDHCGECHHACPDRPNATRTCVARECGFVCASGFFNVDTLPENGCECHRTEGVETHCSDGADNDCDGAVDCVDSECEGMTCTGTGRICAGGACLCPGGEVHESTCTDASDNDCDGLLNCADPDCNELSCGPYGRICSGFSCVCPGGESSELTCGDEADNDCDGAVDCDDADCAERSCADEGQICCALTCVDVVTSNTHCGECDNPCGPTEACVGGGCIDTCTNDCETGQRRCAPGENGWQQCGDFDEDACLEWSTTTNCTGDTDCYEGQCIPAYPPVGTIVINEVLYDGESEDPDEVFIELWGTAGLDLTYYNIVGINGSSGERFAHFNLLGTIPDDGYFVIVHSMAGDGLLAVADMCSDLVDLENGPDSVQLLWGGETVVDALGYGDSGGHFAGEGTHTPDVSPGRSLSRNRAHWDTDDNSVDFHSEAVPTPGRNDDPYYGVSSVGADFIDISTTGADTLLTGDDYSFEIAIGFSFPFFGADQTSVWAGTNGFLTFDAAGSTYYSNQNFPNTLTPNNVIACFWDDLYVNATDGQAIYYQVFGADPNRTLVVQWHELEFLSFSRNPATLTYQAILYETSGDIACQYHVMTSDPDPAWASGGSATVGLENADASDYLLHSYNDPEGVLSPGGLLFQPL